MTNNLIKRYSVFTHGLLEKQVFSFHLYYFSFYLSFRLVRKLVFLFFNVNVYLMEIPCLNKVTIPYHLKIDQIENIWVETQDRIIGVIYKPPSFSNLDFLDRLKVTLRSKGNISGGGTRAP